MGVAQKSTRTKTRRRTSLGQILRSKRQSQLTIESYRDIDQIKSDLRSPKNLAQYKSSKVAEDLPGLGKWYCVECAKWFEGEHSLVTHKKGKPHKRSDRVKALKDEPYTQKEAESAVGLRTDNGLRHASTGAVIDTDVEMAAAQEIEDATIT